MDAILNVYGMLATNYLLRDMIGTKIDDIATADHLFSLRFASVVAGRTRQRVRWHTGAVSAARLTGAPAH